MKDLTIHIAVHLEEAEIDGLTTELFNEALYLALPVEIVLGSPAHDYLTATATTLVTRALEQAKKEYRPELEVTP